MQYRTSEIQGKKHFGRTSFASLVYATCHLFYLFLNITLFVKIKIILLIKKWQNMIKIAIGYVVY